MKDMVKRWWILLAAIAVLIVAAGMLWHIVRSMPSLGPVLAYAEEPEADDAGKVPPGRILGKQVGYADPSALPEHNRRRFFLCSSGFRIILRRNIFP